VKGSFADVRLLPGTEICVLDLVDKVSRDRSGAVDLLVYSLVPGAELSWRDVG
jgi:hypothetical protein